MEKVHTWELDDCEGGSTWVYVIDDEVHFSKGKKTDYKLKRGEFIALYQAISNYTQEGE